jgi:hypothetical protein
MTEIKVQVAYGNPKIVAIVDALAEHHAKDPADVTYDRSLLSFHFDSEEKADSFVRDLQEFLDRYVKTSKNLNSSV